MKKLLVVFFACALVSFSNAQPFETGDNVISAGLGLGNGYVVSGYGFSPTIVASYELGILPKLGIGYLGVGAVFGYNSAKYDYANYRFNNTMIAVRGTYHFDFLSITGNSGFEKFDVYAGLLAGIRAYSYSNYFSGGADGIGGIFVGSKYYFTDSFGAFAEVGAGMSYITLGASFKF